MAYQINLTGQEIDERLQNVGTAEDVAAADGTLYARISKNADDIDELRDAVGHIDSAQTATDKTVTQHTANISALQKAVGDNVRIEALDNGDASASFVAGRNLKVNGWEFYWKDVWEESEPSAIKHIESAGVNAAINEIKGTGADVSAFTFPTTKDEFIAYLKTITFDFSNQPNQVSGYGSVTYGIMNKNAGTTTIVEGMYNDISNKMHRSHIEGQHMTIPDVEYALDCHVEGQDCNIVGYASICHLEGNSNATIHSMNPNAGFWEEAIACHVEGSNNVAGGSSSHAEGQYNAALGSASHCEGKGFYSLYITDWKQRTYRDNDYIVSKWKETPLGKKEGETKIHYKFSAAIAPFSHIEGMGNITEQCGAAFSGLDTGVETVYINGSNHAEGVGNYNGGAASHVEGIRNEINKDAYASHAEGIKNTTQNRAEHASGQYNKSNKASDTFGDAGNTLFSVGCGTSDTDRKNAFEVMQDGTCKYLDVDTGEQIDVGVAKELSTPFNLTIGSTTKKVNGKSAVTFTAEEITDKFNGVLILNLTTASTEADIRKAFTEVNTKTVLFPNPGSVITKLNGNNKGIVVSLGEPDATTLGRSIVVYYGDGTYTIVVKNDFTKVLVPWRKDSSLRDLYVSAGAKYNETTGYYELNGLTDITEEQMSVIWQENLSGWYLKGRTNLTRNIEARGNAGGYNGGIDICNICYNNSNITKFNFGTAPFARYLDNAFSGCTKLETIDTRFPITPYGGVVGPNIFRNCPALKEVRFNMRYVGYSTKMNFPASPLISKDSILSVIQTTSTEGSVKPLVVVGLNESAYNRLKDDTDITAALTEKNGFVTLIQI